MEGSLGPALCPEGEKPLEEAGPRELSEDGPPRVLEGGAAVGRGQQRPCRVCRVHTQCETLKCSVDTLVALVSAAFPPGPQVGSPLGHTSSEALFFVSISPSPSGRGGSRDPPAPRPSPHPPTARRGCLCLWISRSGLCRVTPFPSARAEAVALRIPLELQASVFPFDPSDETFAAYIHPPSSPGPSFQENGETALS